MQRPRRKKFLRHLGTTILVWVLALTFIGFVRIYGLEEEGLYTLNPTITFPLAPIILLQGLAMGTILGSIYATLDFWLDQRFLKRFPYGLVVIFRSLVHILILPLLIIVTIYISFLVSGGNTDYFWMVVKRQIFVPTFYLILIYTGIVSILFNTFRQMNAMFGPGILYKVMTGRYHQPKEEQRIFMFLDLKSSTTYAERLGHMLYSELIQDCFYDLTEAVRQHNAEIYQYVGDEAVLTWTLKNGLGNSNCLWAYFSFEQTIQKRAAYYFNKYDLVPVFKAGVNMGPVSVAEVGVVKKEIAYHSDVLNTAARIQGQCNRLGKCLLISGYLQQQIQDWDGLQFEEVGTVSLKGKIEQIDLFSVFPTTVSERPFAFAE